MIPANLIVKSFKTDGTGHTIESVEIYNDDGTTFEMVSDIEKSLKAYKHESDYLFTKSTDATPTKAYDTLTSQVSVTYESTTDTLLYSGDTYTRSSDDDIIL